MDDSAPRPDAARILELAKRFFFRSVVGNFQTSHAVTEEREVLKAARKPVEDPLAQDYAAWRRGMLWIGAVVMAMSSVVELISWIDVLGEPSNPVTDVVKILTTILFLSVPAATVLMFTAAVKWTDLKRSRRFARFSWFVLFLTPLVAAVIPYISITAPDANEAVKKGGGLLIGLVLFYYVGKSIVALCAGVIRSSITLKTLLPESPAPAWAAVFFGPTYGLILVALLVIFTQMLGSVTLLLAMGCLIAAPLLYIFYAKQVLRPHRPEEVGRAVLSVRTKALALNIAGAVLLVAWMIEHLDLGVLDLLKLLIGFWGAFLLLTVVASDFILAILCLGHRRSKEFLGSPLALELDRKFAGLESVGLTRLDVSLKTTEIGAPLSIPEAEETGEGE